MVTLNVNVGLLGHVDSGKTTLAKALSEIASTAAFDKNPQAQLRGITLDLGFSSFKLPHVPEQLAGVEGVQITLVDCPGHASLIRTIIGGAQIIDLILLVVDATKGVQTQTSECLVLGGITCRKLIVVLNKIDLIADEEKDQFILKMKKRLRKTLHSTAFPSAPIAAVSAQKHLVQELLDEISKNVFVPPRDTTAPFLLAIDHCFKIKGKGTVLTGTILQGTVAVEEVVELPSVNLVRKIKSMQVFKKDVSSAAAGDRVGICVTQFEPKLMERGLAAAPSYVNQINYGIVAAKRIKFFKGDICSKSKFHVTIGYETLLATITCFGGEQKDFDLGAEYFYKASLSGEDQNEQNCFILLSFERPLWGVPKTLVIGSKLDLNHHGNACRIAFWGPLVWSSKINNLTQLKIVKTKEKTGLIERFPDGQSAIVKNMFQKNSNLMPFLGMIVELADGTKGRIEGSFGKSGKIKIATTVLDLDLSQLTQNSVVRLRFKKNIFGTSNKIFQ